MKKLLCAMVSPFLAANSRFPLLTRIPALCIASFFVVATSASTDLSDEDGWTWHRILTQSLGTNVITSNGNVYPPPTKETATDCLLLVSRNQIMRECPFGDPIAAEKEQSCVNGQSTVVYRSKNGGLRGAVSAAGTNQRRLWLLSSQGHRDQLLELDTVDGAITQTLTINGTRDGHDIVRVGARIFLVDTFHGDVVEFEVPASAAPYTGSSIAEGAKTPQKDEFVTISKRHKGFARQDHINNVAIHPDLLITSVHGGSGLKKKIRGPSPTRLSALSRGVPEESGRELNPELDGFYPVKNAGTWCHGIAFWMDKASSQVKLITLDSKAGSLVSVVLSGPGEGTRDVLWEPDLDKYPVLVPPKGVALAYQRSGGAQVFSKGLAVQGGVAYFGASYARAPDLRQTVPETLLVAVDLATGKEVHARVVRSAGLINQVVTESHLGWPIQMPEEVSSIEITFHGDGGKMVNHCLEDESESSFCRIFEKDERDCKNPDDVDIERALNSCCTCGGGKRSRQPHLAGELDMEIFPLDNDVTATVTFTEKASCVNKANMTNNIPLTAKNGANDLISSIEEDVDKIVTHMCNVDVGTIALRLEELGDEGFSTDGQLQSGNAIYPIDTRIKPDTTAIRLVFSTPDLSQVYHFPHLDIWLPLLQEHVLGPLGIPLDQIVRCQFANMPMGSAIHFHTDNKKWAGSSHRVHVPIITHNNVFFLVQAPLKGNLQQMQTLRIRSFPGQAYEFNNRLSHAVFNHGGPGRIHLIIDWIDSSITDRIQEVVRLNQGDVCKQGMKHCGPTRSS